MEFVLYKLNLDCKNGINWLQILILEIIDFYLEIFSPNSGLI